VGQEFSPRVKVSSTESYNIIWRKYVHNFSNFNKGNGQRSKRKDLRYNFVREQVVNKILAMVHLSGVDMTSDILTNPLGPTAFLHLRPKLLGMAAVMSLKQLKRLERKFTSVQS
jgi:hypothetical protein